MLPAILYLGVLGALYALVYYINHKTPVPKGCEEIIAACGSCTTNICGAHPSQQIKEIKHV